MRTRYVERYCVHEKAMELRGPCHAAWHGDPAVITVGIAPRIFLLLLGSAPRGRRTLGQHSVKFEIVTAAEDDKGFSDKRYSFSRIRLYTAAQ